MREYFCAYHSMLGGTRKLSDAECGRLFRALLRYSSGEDVGLINLQGREEVLFDVYSQQIDRDVAAYEGKCATNKANAAKRSQANGSDGKRSQANGSDGKRSQANGSDGTQDKDKDKDKDKGKDEDDTTGTSFPPYLKKKIDDNYKHSHRARCAVAQVLVDQINAEQMPPAQDKNLYSHILDALEEGLSVEQIYDCACKSTYPGEFNALMLWENGGKWSHCSSECS